MNKIHLDLIDCDGNIKMFVGSTDDPGINTRISNIPGAKYASGGDHGPGWRMKFSISNLTNIKTIADADGYDIPMFSVAMRDCLDSNRQIKRDRYKDRISNNGIPLMEDIEPTRDNIGYSKFLKNIGVEVSPDAIAAVFRLSQYWVVSEERRELTVQIAKEIKETIDELSRIDPDAPTNNGSLTRLYGIGKMDSKLKELGDRLEILEREAKMIISSMDNEIRRRASWKKVM